MIFCIIRMQLTTEILNETTATVRESLQKMNIQIESMATMLDRLTGQVPEKQIDYIAKYIMKAILSIRQVEYKTERIDDCLYYLASEMNLLQTKLYAAVNHNVDISNTNSVLVEKISKLEAMVLALNQDSTRNNGTQEVGLYTKHTTSTFDEAMIESKDATFEYVASSMNTPAKEKASRHRSRSASAKKILKKAIRRLSLSRDRTPGLNAEIYTSSKYK